MDEPTSALDAETESDLVEAIEHLVRDKTTFVIAHRLSTIRRANQIIVLENGAIVERGTHEALAAANGLYRKLYDAFAKPIAD